MFNPELGTWKTELPFGQLRAVSLSNSSHNLVCVPITPQECSIIATLFELDLLFLPLSSAVSNPQCDAK